MATEILHHQSSPVPQHQQQHHSSPVPYSSNAPRHDHDESGPTAADFAGENVNLDAPRMVQNRDGTVEDWNNITNPGGNDVLLGRGGGTNNHSGNVKFRKLVNEHKMAYLACSKVDKPKVAREVVAIWRKMSPAGRFLARKDENKRGPGSVKSNDNVWYEVGDKKAREKASQCLRERTPDVLPYIKHLRDQQNAVTEYGIMQMQHQQPPSPYGAPYSPQPQHHLHPHNSPMHHHPHHMPAPDYHLSAHHHHQHHQQMAARRNSAPQPLPHLHHHLPSQPAAQPQYGPRRASTNSVYEDEYQQQMFLMHQTMMQQQSPYNAYDQHSPVPPAASEDTEDNHNNNTDGGEDDAKRVAPDRAISLMSLTPMEAPHDDQQHHELSLEDYRQQLEEYIANCQAEEGPHAGNLNDGHHSDLEDDWEKERERALRESAAKKRGVGRNVSGLSCFSNKSGMSLVSNLSSFDARDAKMNMARSVCSNLSLMSELTDLSQNIDNLSIYDD